MGSPGAEGSPSTTSQEVLPVARGTTARAAGVPTSSGMFALGSWQRCFHKQPSMVTRIQKKGPEGLLERKAARSALTRCWRLIC